MLSLRTVARNYRAFTFARYATSLDSILIPYDGTSEIKPSDLNGNASADDAAVINKALKCAKGAEKEATVTTLFNIGSYSRVAVVGTRASRFSQGERVQTVQAAAGAGVRALRRLGGREIHLPTTLLGDELSMWAEAAFLATHTPPRPRTVERDTEDEEEEGEDSDDDDEAATIEIVVDESDATANATMSAAFALAEAEAQARSLAELPANLLTPEHFGEATAALLGELEHVSVQVHNQDWIAERSMGLMIGVAQGSQHAPRFAEVRYEPPNSGGRAPLVLVGKGVTFDSGGISLKPSANMHLMKGDMGGAAAVVGAMFGCAQLGVPRPVHAFVPMVENMPSASATRPGDVLCAADGTSVEIDNTDAEGRLILADALVYAQRRVPDAAAYCTVATLTGAMDVALGGVYTGAFSTDDATYAALEQAGAQSGQRMWRMPLHAAYRRQLRSNVADLLNCSRQRGGGACTAAIFLAHFVRRNRKFVHIDIAGTMHSNKTSGIFNEGMTGVPTRALVRFAEQLP